MKTHQSIFTDLENLYEIAIQKENLAIAFKIKELQLKHNAAVHTNQIHVESLTQHDIENIIRHLESMPDKDL